MILDRVASVLARAQHAERDGIAICDLDPGTYSGMSLAEYRLHVGFIHMHCPFIGWNQLSDIVKLSWASGYAVTRRLLIEARVNMSFVRVGYFRSGCQKSPP